MNSNQTVNAQDYLNYIIRNNNFVAQNLSLKHLLEKFLEKFKLENVNEIPSYDITFDNPFTSDLQNAKINHQFSFEMDNQNIHFFMVKSLKVLNNFSSYLCGFMLDTQVLFSISETNFKLFVNDNTKNFIECHNLSDLTQHFINTYSKYILPEKLTEIVSCIRDISYIYDSEFSSMFLVMEVYYNNAYIRYDFIYNTVSLSYTPTLVILKYPYDSGFETWGICEYFEDNFALILNPYHTDLTLKYIPYHVFDELRCCFSPSNRKENITACNDMWNDIRTILANDKKSQIKTIEILVMDCDNSIEYLNDYFENYPTDANTVTHRFFIDKKIQNKLPSELKINDFEIKFEPIEPQIGGI